MLIAHRSLVRCRGFSPVQRKAERLAQNDVRWDGIVHHCKGELGL
jgi:hypothetical protein